MGRTAVDSDSSAGGLKTLNNVATYSFSDQPNAPAGRTMAGAFGQNELRSDEIAVGNYD